MIMIYLDRPKGYICRIKRSETMEVPDSSEKFPSILHILAAVLNAKVEFVIFVYFLISPLTYS